MPRLRLLLADDHILLCQGLKKILQERSDWAVVAEATDGRSAVRLAELHAPDVAVLDIAMPLLNGIEATLQLTKRCPDVKVLILSMHVEEAYVIQAMKAGARGYLPKDSADTDFINAISAVAAGKSFFSPAVSDTLLNDERRRLSGRGIVDRFDTLTTREREVLQLAAEGYTNKEIAELLTISPVTVETHRSRVLQKLDVHSTAELVLYAVRRGVIS